MQSRRQRTGTHDICDVGDSALPGDKVLPGNKTIPGDNTIS